MQGHELLRKSDLPFIPNLMCKSRTRLEGRDAVIETTLQSKGLSQ